MSNEFETLTQQYREYVAKQLEHTAALEEQVLSQSMALTESI